MFARWGALCLGCLIGIGAFAQGPARPTAFALGRAQGLPQVGVQEVLQDPAGRFWVSAFRQIFLGDGYHFLPIPLPAAIAEAEGQVQAMVLDEAGSPWIYTEAGLYRWEGRAFQRQSTPATPRLIRNLQSSPDGHLWIWAERTLLHRAPGGTFGEVPPPLPAANITALAPDLHGGGATLCQGLQLWRYHAEGTWEALPDIPNLGTESAFGARGELPLLAADAEGYLWAQLRHRILTLAPGEVAWKPVIPPRTGPAPPDLYPGRILADGAFWLVDGPHFARGLRGAFTTLPGPEDRTFYGISPLLLDREGHLWWSEGRLFHLKGRGLWLTHGPASGLPLTEIWQILEARGTLWIGSGQGLFHLVGGQWKRLGPSQRMNQVICTQDGSLWMRGSNLGALWHLPPGATTPTLFTGEGLTPAVPVTRLATDGRAIYLLTRDRRGFMGTREGGRWTFRTWPLPPATQVRGAQSLSSDPKGRIWLLGQQARPLMWTGNGWESLPGPEIPAAIAIAFHPTSDLMAVVNYSPLKVNLYRLGQGGLTFQAALPIRETMGAQLGYAALFDRKGRLWVTTDGGVARCTFGATVRIDAFSEDEGLPSADCDQYSLLESASGEIYVGTTRGLAEFQAPRETPLPPLPSPTLLGAQFNRAPIFMEGGRLEMDQQRGLLNLIFSQPTLALGATARLQWRDLNREDPWADLDRGSLSLQDPAAGHRRLALRAFVSNDLTSPEYRLELDVRPPLWRRPAAYALYALLLFGLGWLLHSLRSRMLQARNVQLERTVSERTADLAKANDQLAQASRAKSAFLADMSHELRTPLNAILLYAELIHGESTDRDLQDLAEDTARIQGAGQHLLSLINGIMDLSKIEAGKLELRPVPMALHPLLQEVAGVLEPLARKQSDALLIECDPTLGLILGDEVKLRQILLNLGGNAVKFTKAGQITLRARATQGSIHLQVADTGPGISPENLDRLFRAYEQPTQEMKGYERVDGTGLGLTISRRLAELMGGALTVESELGRGTTFTIQIPHVPAPCEL